MEVQHKQNKEEGSFFITEGDAHVAEMFYEMTSPGVMSIYHTEVDDELQGQNIGRQLVEAGVNFAREHHLKIEPSCSFAQSIFVKEKDFRDVLV